jgi:hypothetical protein
MTNKLTVMEINVETGEITNRDMTEKEIADYWANLELLDEANIK